MMPSAGAASTAARRRPVGLGGELRALLDLVAPVLRQRSAAIWRPRGLRTRYGAYLAAMHATVRSSVPLMERAAQRCDGRGGTHATLLRAYFDTHIEEERGHDEWLIDDMVAAGVRPRSALDDQPWAAVTRLVGPQYYLIEHADPASLLGYIAVLESNAPSTLLAAELAGATGLPPSAFHTLHRHAELDGAHSGQLYDFLDSLDSEARRRTGIRMNALRTTAALADLLDAIAAR